MNVKFLCVIVLLYKRGKRFVENISILHQDEIVEGL